MTLTSRLFAISLVIALLAVCLHEFLIRTVGQFPRSYDLENVDYWADQRNRVPELNKDDVIIIGSSRAHFDINIHLWDSITGRRPLMLAYPGSCPLLALDDLVNHTSFNGLIVIGVSPGLFFSLRQSWASGRIKKALDQHQGRTYAQLLNHNIYKLIDSQFSYINESISLMGLIDGLPIPDRDSVKSGKIWPPMVHMDAYRNIRMLPVMENDTVIQRRQKDIWFNPNPRNRIVDTLQTILQDYSGLVKAFKSRGGRVAFIRPPVTGYYLKTESRLFPRKIYWDELIRQCASAGYHYADHPVTKNMVPPEWSHLNRKDSDTYTQTIITLLKQDKLL